MSKVIADQSQRLAALTPNESFIVQAPAGSGKTELLSQRFLKLLSFVEKPEEIIALTFTRKAASEMRARIFLALQRAADEPEPSANHEKQTWALARNALQQSAEMGWDLADNPNRLKVQTLDSLCANLVKQMPLLSRFGAQAAIADDPYPIYAQAARALLNSLDDNPAWKSALERLLLHLDNNHNRIERLFTNMLARRDQWLPYILEAKDADTLRHELESSLEHVVIDNLRQAVDNFPLEKKDEILYLARLAAHYLDSEQVDSDVKNCFQLNDLPTAKPEDLSLWQGLAALLLTKTFTWRKQVTKTQGFPAAATFKDKEQKAFYKDAKTRMTTLLGDLVEEDDFRLALENVCDSPPASYDDKQWFMLEALVELLPVLAAHLTLEFQQQGLVDFTAISSGALNALGQLDDPSDLALKLDYQIKHLLIDEFQDTSASQFRLLEKLTNGWEAGDGRSLFVVGDPMQSIYRFREAEVGLFLRTRVEGLGQVPLTPLHLTVNFRSEASIINWINDTFSISLPKKEDISAGAVSYSASIAASTEHREQAVLCHAYEDRLDEAQRIVEIIKQQQKSAPDTSIAILVRSRRHLLEILPALVEADLTYQAVDIDSLAYRPVVSDLWILTRALCHPMDRIAWLALLRAPWCGLELPDLHSIANNNANTTIWQQVKAAINTSDIASARLQRIITVIDRALELRQRCSLRTLVETTWLNLGGPACLDHLSDHDDAAAFFILLETMESAGDLPEFENFQARLKKLFAITDSAANPKLQVMTIHKSKGLEFDTVIIPGLASGSAPSDTPLLTWMERPRLHGQIDLLMAPIKSDEDQHDPIYNYLRQQDRKKELHEKGRLFYVAATRAKSQLHLFANLSQDEEGEIKAPASASLLAQTWEALAEQFEYHAASDDLIDEENGFPQYQRLSINWKSPVAALQLEQLDAANPMHLANDFVWQAQAHRHIGTAIHRLLQIICQQGVNNWTVTKIQQHKKNWPSLLLSLGVLPNEIEPALAIIEAALTNTLNDEKGKWILANHYEISYCEWPLSFIEEGRNKNIIIDRLFIDDNTIWIVDYKTSQPHNDELDGFLAREAKQYQAQLELYAKVVGQMFNKEIRTGLYFPLVQAWKEVSTPHHPVV